MEELQPEGRGGILPSKTEIFSNRALRIATHDVRSSLPEHIAGILEGEAYHEKMEQFPKEPTPEEIDADIEKLLEELSNYGEIYSQGSPELQEEWYWTEMEAKVAEDRQTAKTNLEQFITKLRELKEKS